MEKYYTWSSTTFSKVAGLKLKLLHGCFSRFFNCKNDTKSCIASHKINYFQSKAQFSNVSRMIFQFKNGLKPRPTVPKKHLPF